PRTVTINTAACTTTLQADGFSSCPVTVSIPGATSASRFAVDVTATENGAAVDVSSLPLLSTDGTQPRGALAGVPLDDNGRGAVVVHSPARNRELELTLTVTDELTSEGTAVVRIQRFADASSLSIDATDRIAAGAATQVTLTGRTFNGSVLGGGVVELTIDGASTTDNECLSGTTATLNEQGTCTFQITADAARTDPITIDGLLGLPDGTTLPGSTTIGIALVGEVTIDRTPPGVISLRPDGATAVPGTNFPTEQTISLKLKKATLGSDENLSQASVVIAVATASRSLIALSDFDPAAGGDTDDGRVATIVNPADGEVQFTVAARNALAIGNAQITVTVTDPNPVAGVSPTTTHTIDIALVRQRALSSILFVTAVPAQLGIPGGHLPRTSTVSFRVFDEAGVGVANEAVSFEVRSSTDARVDATGQTGADGTVAVQLQAGDVATPVVVKATVISRPDLTASSTVIAIVGGLPNSTANALQCATKAAFDPFTTECVAVLSDQFGNRVTTPYQVQFRAEGGNIPAVADSGTNGEAVGEFVFSEPGPGSADLRQWTHSRLPPPSVANTTGAIQQAFPGCFDRTARTPCDLIGICNSSNPGIAAHCPLPGSQRTGASLCTDDITQDALDALELGGDPDPAVHEAWQEAVFGGDPDAEVQFVDYQQRYRVCGFPLSCLVPDRLGGLDYDSADDCPVNPGCLDYSAATECPQNGLLDVLASVQGQEGFDDLNGNGVRDANETFVDYPEPFLDKNSSCSYDDLNHLSSQGSTPGRLAPNDVIRFSDLYIETDPGAPTQFFGFAGTGGVREETNGVFDEQTDIFMKTSILHLSGAPRLQFGLPGSVAACGANNTNVVACGEFPGTSVCTETAATTARGDKPILEGCLPPPDEFREGETLRFVFRWSDFNGNCPVEDFDGAPTVVADKLLELAVDDFGYSSSECGGLLGAIEASNAERPWCEEHPALGAGNRGVVATVA
ncbi:MAG TPA: hypothetical protein VGF99_16435, partial [Myxococcota bacterium]